MAEGQPVWKAGASTVLALFAFLVFGFFLGAVIATRVFATGTMGWDQFADFIGGALLGGMAGLVVAAFVVWKCGNRMRAVLGLIALLGAAAAIAYANMTPPNIQRDAATATLPPPPVEPFSLTIVTADPMEGRRAAETAIPWRHLRIGSDLVFDYIMRDTPTMHCVVPGALQSQEAVTAVRMLRGELERLPENPNCEAPCPECTAVTLHWYLDGDQRSLTVGEACWQSNPDLATLRRQVDALVTGFGQTGLSCTIVRPAQR